MLYDIVSADKEGQFKEYVNALKKLYWPKNQYETQALKAMLPSATDLQSKGIDKDDEKIRETERSLDRICDEVCEKGVYRVDPSTRLPFPFAADFHKYFFHRKWEEPLADPQSNYEEYIHLNKPGDGQDYRNYSRNYRNYRHFINVVLALARLIRYFQEPDRIKELFKSLPMQNAITQDKEICNHIVYGQKPDLRTFKLMLAGFYHDLGKTVTDARHGMEGYNILALNTTKARYELNQVLRKYSPDEELDREDYLFVANLVLWHDQFGTIGTGEDSYFPLVKIIKEIASYSRKYGEDNIETLALQHLFDVWLLNVADVMVSLHDKFELQKDWNKWDGAESRINEFFGVRDKEPDDVPEVAPKLKADLQTRRKSGYLRFDLALSLAQLREYLKKPFSADQEELSDTLVRCTRQNCVGRIRRLLTSSLPSGLSEAKRRVEAMERFAGMDPKEVTQDHLDAIGEHVELPSSVYRCNKVSPEDWKGLLKQLEEAAERLNGVVAGIEALSDQEWDSSIRRSMESLGDADEFCDRLSWICKMDYSLGFFGTIAKGALRRIAQEIGGKTKPTGWLRTWDEETSWGKKYLDKIQAQLFADNYSATVVRVFGHLLFREPCSPRPQNIEFRDAADRLCDAAGRLIESRIDKTISLEGPHRSGRAIQLILQTVFLY